jgi:hypothetical protein
MPMMTGQPDMPGPERNKHIEFCVTGGLRDLPASGCKTHRLYSAAHTEGLQRYGPKLWLWWRWVGQKHWHSVRSVFGMVERSEGAKGNRDQDQGGAAKAVLS